MDKKYSISQLNCNNDVASQHLSHLTLHMQCEITQKEKLLPILKLRCWLNATQVNNNVNNLSYSTSVVQQGRNVPAFLVMTICRCHFVACKQRSTMQCVCVGTSQQTVLVFELKPNNSCEADTAALRFLPLPAWLFLIFVCYSGGNCLDGLWMRPCCSVLSKQKESQLSVYSDSGVAHCGLSWLSAWLILNWFPSLLRIPCCPRGSCFLSGNKLECWRKSGNRRKKNLHFWIPQFSDFSSAGHKV